MIILIKNIFKEDYISRQAGEKLRLMIVDAILKKTKLVLDFNELIIASTSFFDEGFAKLVDEKINLSDFFEYIVLKDLNKNDEKVLRQVSNYRGFVLEQDSKRKWRLCPFGEHWVSEHPRVSKSGARTIVDGHCRKNIKNKDVIYAEELIEIAKRHFKNTKVKPLSNSLGFPDGNSFDELIGGWCEYWNDTLKPKIKLDPNIVKVLIATESGFVPRPIVPKGHTAIGLLQLMPKTIKYLSSRSKELKDHYVEIDEKTAEDPVVNIAAGIRWLFRKYELTEKKLKRPPSWTEVLYDYKVLPMTNLQSQMK
jgi:hypothetical protein